MKEIRTVEPDATTVQRFDESGEKLEETKRFGSAGGIRESWKRTREADRTNVEYKSYYNDGRLERREGTILNGAGMVTEKRFEPSHGGHRRWEYKYDATGKLIEGRFYEESKYGPEVWSSSYDGRGNLTEVRHANTAGRLISRRSYSYEGIFSESGTSRNGGGSRSNIVMNRQAAEWYNQDGAVEFSWTYMYDARGNLIEKLYRHPEPSFEIKWAYTYSQNNEQTSEVYYDSRGSVFSGYRTTNEYDSKGRVIATIQHDASGTQLSSSRFEYNNQGDLTESITYNPDDSLESSTTYEYQYDTKGNWVVKKTLYTNNLREEYGVPTLVQYRTIEYFD